MATRSRTLDYARLNSIAKAKFHKNTSTSVDASVGAFAGVVRDGDGYDMRPLTAAQPTYVTAAEEVGTVIDKVLTQQRTDRVFFCCSFFLLKKNIVFMSTVVKLKAAHSNRLLHQFGDVEAAADQEVQLCTAAIATHLQTCARTIELIGGNKRSLGVVGDCESKIRRNLAR